jgi:hypothetical protein
MTNFFTKCGDATKNINTFLCGGASVIQAVLSPFAILNPPSTAVDGKDTINSILDKRNSSVKWR